MYVDNHLSETGEQLRRQQVKPVDVAIIEAVSITESGEIVPTASVGNNEIFAAQAKKVIVEINLSYSLEMEGAHDIYCASHFPNAAPIGIMSPRDRVGSIGISVPPEKIVAIVITDEMDTPSQNLPPDGETAQIAGHLIDFFKNEIKHGRLTQNLRPPAIRYRHYCQCRHVRSPDRSIQPFDHVFGSIAGFDVRAYRRRHDGFRIGNSHYIVRPEKPRSIRQLRPIQETCRDTSSTNFKSP